MIVKRFPNWIKSLRGFLGLIGYYRNYIRNYDIIATSLIELLKKNAFHWSQTILEDFEKLKSTVTNPPILKLLDFNLTFTIERDVCATGVGVSLMQLGQPIAYMIKTLKSKALNLSTYEKELLVVVKAVQKWMPYLLGQQFVIRIDQMALKFYWNR